MPYLVDGYNLLHAAGLAGRGLGPGSLERSRRVLLNLLAAALEQPERAATTVVFDAKDPPPGLPRETVHHDILVQYASRDEEADDLIEALIRRHPAPRRLTVVSSDHRIQRAARRRKAKPVDSDTWWNELQRRRRWRPAPSAEKPDSPLSEEEIQAWLRQFPDAAGQQDPPAPNDPGDRTAHRPLDADLDNPFPPGYGEDLLDEEP